MRNTLGSSFCTSRNVLADHALEALKRGHTWTPAELLLVLAFCETLRTFDLNNQHMTTDLPGLSGAWGLSPHRLTQGSAFALVWMPRVEDPDSDPQLHIRCLIASGRRAGEFTARVDPDGLVCSSAGERHRTEPPAGLLAYVHRWLTDSTPCVID